MEQEVKAYIEYRPACMINYVPRHYDSPTFVDEVSTWNANPKILKDIIVRAGIKTDKALEFGVWHGCSISALAYYFKEVTGVDLSVQAALGPLKGYRNITLFEKPYEEFIKGNDDRYDLIHIDVVHSYEETYPAGEWAVQHSNCVLFHDTIINDIRRVCEDLALKYGFIFYNYMVDCQLGILIKK